MQHGHINYLKYLKDVLGLKHFDFIKVWPEGIQCVDKVNFHPSWELGFHPSSQNHLLFLISGDSWESLNPNLKELFLKVRAAMKLNSQVQAPAIVAHWDDFNLNVFLSTVRSPVELIYFEEDKSKLDKNLRAIGDHSLTIIPSLRLMMTKQDFKKLAWERLKILATKIARAY